MNSSQMTKQERSVIKDRVLKGMAHEKYAEDGNRAYKLAERNFTAAQLRALHRAMKELYNELYERDAE